MPKSQVEQTVIQQHLDDYRPLKKPFLKWAGGKARLIDEIASVMPTNYEKYVEPFLGGGSVFFRLCNGRSILSDSNTELMNCYKIVKSKVDDLIVSLDFFKGMKYDEKTYYDVRKLDEKDLSEVDRAARFIYLNRTAYNGLYRVNHSGQFNVPFARYKSLALPSDKILTEASDALRSSKLICADFEEVLRKYSESDDFVFLDPPYPAVSKYSDFNRYTKNFFTKDDHRRLGKLVLDLDDKGCKIVITNAEHPLIREIYSDDRFVIKTVLAPRFINCKGDKRGNVPELLIRNKWTN